MKTYLFGSGSKSRPRRVLPPAIVLLVLPILALACGSTVAPTSTTTAPAGPTTSTAAPSTTPSTKATSVALPDTPAGVQATWLIAALAHAPIPEADIRAHFDSAFLAKVSPTLLNQTIGAQPQAITVVSIVSSRADAVVFIVSGEGGNPLQVSLSVDGQGLIGGLHIGPTTPPPTIPAAPTTWDGVDAAVRSVAPDVHLLVSRLSGDSFQPLHGIDPGTAAPLGSTFKLYVLDALAKAVQGGSISWDQQVTVTQSLKSFPSGVLQNQPDGTKVSVKEAASDMISISDNTAANLLMDVVGRSAIESNLASTGMADPAKNEPFLSTREMFILKLQDWPRLADSYLAADTAGRRALLAGTVDPAPLPRDTVAAAWTAPRDIDTLEWFASAEDLARLYGSLLGLARQPALTAIGDVLSINDGGLQLDKSTWKTTWFKGGSEPGVLTLDYLATTQSGASYVVTVLAEDSAKAIDENAALTLLSAVKGAFTLAVAGK